VTGKLVVQIRGTSGSGKTWVVKQIMASLGYWQPVMSPCGRFPLYNLSESKVAVLGVYGGVNRGCDRLGSARTVYDLACSLLDGQAEAVLAEGLLLSNDVKWTVQLRDFDLRVLFLSTPLDVCLRQLESRREQSGNKRPHNPMVTSNRVRHIQSARTRLQELGVWCPMVSPSQAVRVILAWLSARKLR
jgi:hypothetical protein